MDRSGLAAVLRSQGLSGRQLEIALGAADDYAAHEIEQCARSVPWPWPVRKAAKSSARKDEAS
jgi:hypothetical protein